MKIIFKVEQSDLVGDIERFPIEVVEKMIEEQAKQGNCPNVRVFQNRITADVNNGGFNWETAEDKAKFWTKVILCEDFDLFFEKYPKKTNLLYIVGNSKIGIDIIKTLEKYGGVNRHNLCGNSDSVLYYIAPNDNTIRVCNMIKENSLYELLMATYTPIDAEECVLEVTMEEIAKKFGIDITKLRIKK